MAEDQDFQTRMRRIEALIGTIEGLSDPTAQSAARELVSAVLDLHAAGLAKLLEHVGQVGEPGRAILAACGADSLVGSLLLLHGLHPLAIETRVRLALDKVRPLLRSHGGDVELLAVVEGTVRLRLLGKCDGCPSSALTLKQAVEEAIYEAAPDVTTIEAAGAADRPPVPANGFVPLSVLGQRG